jgi:hypothetical protein
MRSPCSLCVFGGPPSNVARQQLDKHVPGPLLVNGSVNTFPRYRIHVQQQENCWTRCFICCECSITLLSSKRRLSYGHRSQGGPKPLRIVLARVSRNLLDWLNTEWQPRVEAGSNTLTVALRVAGGCEKGTHCLGVYNWGILFLGNITTGTWPSRLGGLESGTVKYGLEFCGTWTQEWLRWRGPPAVVNDRPVQLLERVPHMNKPTTVRQ